MTNQNANKLKKSASMTVLKVVCSIVVILSYFAIAPMFDESITETDWYNGLVGYVNIASFLLSLGTYIYIRFVASKDVYKFKEQIVLASLLVLIAVLLTAFYAGGLFNFSDMNQAIINNKAGINMNYLTVTSFAFTIICFLVEAEANQRRANKPEK